MAESYCLKSCAECAREGCPGCKAGAFAGQCEIIKCCKEKNHESCDSCTRELYCPTRTGRAQMPQKVFDMHRREAELAVKYRGDAVVMARWVIWIFWSMIAMNVVDLLGLLKTWVPVMQWVDLAFTLVLLGVTFRAFYSLRGVDDRFGTVAVLETAAYLITTMIEVFLPGESVLKTVVQLACAVVCIIAIKRKCETFQDTLSGISRDMSRKWENQWKLYKISLWMVLGGLVFCIVPLIGLLGLLAVIGAACIVVFVSIREYVYLWQTAKACEAFAGQ